MGKDILYFLIFLVIGLELIGCGKDIPVSSYKKTGKEGLLIVVENNNLLDSVLEAGYSFFTARTTSTGSSCFHPSTSSPTGQTA